MALPARLYLFTPYLYDPDESCIRCRIEGNVLVGMLLVLLLKVLVDACLPLVSDMEDVVEVLDGKPVLLLCETEVQLRR